MERETLKQEFDRLVREYESANDANTVKEEAWNLIADFAIANAAVIYKALED